MPVPDPRPGMPYPDPDPLPTVLPNESPQPVPAPYPKPSIVDPNVLVHPGAEPTNFPTPGAFPEPQGDPSRANPGPPVEIYPRSPGPAAYTKVDPAVGVNWNAQIPMKPADKSGLVGLAGLVGPVGPVGPIGPPIGPPINMYPGVYPGAPIRGNVDVMWR